LRHKLKTFRSIKAISPVIAVLLMIAIAVISSLIVYAWVTGYVGSTTSRIGNAVQIQSAAKDKASGDLIIYVQNVGQGAIELRPQSSVYINGKLQILQSGSFSNKELKPGETIQIDTGFTVTSDEVLTIKVVTSEGIYSEIKASRITEGNAITEYIPLFEDNFESGMLTSSWLPYNGNGGTETVQLAVFKSGQYAADFSIPSSPEAYAAAYYEIAPVQSTLYCKADVLLTNLPVNGRYIQISPNTADGNRGSDFVTVWVFNNGGTYQWALGYRTNSVSLTYVYSSSPAPQINTWYSLQIKAVSGAGNGEAVLYVNGVEVCGVTGLTNNHFGPSAVYLNAYSANGLSLHCYVDNVIVDSKYIQP
jgi:FlaG/FlaF family flagellin (archaellin)